MRSMHGLQRGYAASHNAVLGLSGSVLPAADIYIRGLSRRTAMVIALMIWPEVIEVLCYHFCLLSRRKT